MRLDRSLDALVITSLRLTPEMHEAVKQKATQLNMTASDIIRHCIDKSLNNLQ